MKEVKGIEVEYNFTINDNIQSMKNLLTKFTQTNNYEDAKEVMADKINTVINSYIKFSVHKTVLGDIFDPDHLSCKITFLGDEDICIQFIMIGDDNKIKTIGRVMTLENIIGNSYSISEAYRLMAQMNFSQYIKELCKEMNDYMIENDEKMVKNG